MNAIMIQNLKKNYGSFEVSLPRLDLRQENDLFDCADILASLL